MTTEGSTGHRNCFCLTPGYWKDLYYRVLKKVGEPSPTTGLSGLSSLGRSYHDCVKFATAAQPSSWSGSALGSAEEAAHIDDRSARLPGQGPRQVGICLDCRTLSPLRRDSRSLRQVQVASKRPTCANGDGYSWRKYGEKYVKGSPFPRSYYKCSHLGCPVKKIIERDAASGHLYQTTSQGKHCHPTGNLVPDSSQVCSRPDSRRQECWSSRQSPEDDWRHHATEEDDGNDTIFSMKGDVSSPPGSPGCESDPWDQAAAQPVNWREAQQEAKRRRLEQEAVARLTAMKEARDGWLPDAHYHDQHDDDPDSISPAEGTIRSRRTNLASGSSRHFIEVPLSSGSVDDGYRWRKYGQKMVKGNIHPRSYYKCTYSGCGVRKHVERSSLHPDRLLITYEGEHTHSVPDVGNGRPRRPSRAGAMAERPSIISAAAQERFVDPHLGPRYLSSQHPHAMDDMDRTPSAAQRSGAAGKSAEGPWSWPQGAAGIPSSGSSVPYTASSFLRQAARSGFRRPTIILPPPTPIPSVAHQDKQELESASWDPSRLLSTPSSRSSRDDETPLMSPANLRRLSHQLNC